MEMIYYCANCDKFFYFEANNDTLSPACTHCGCEHTAACQLSKEVYSSLYSDKKEQWKANIRNKHPTQEAIIQQNNIVRNRLLHEKRMGILFVLHGCRGRSITMCKDKCIIKTDVTVGSVITGNATDGEKVIFFKHCSGLQFKEAGFTIGYLQFETPSMQMNNMASNFFSENTFTFDLISNGITNELMREVFYYAMDLVQNSHSGADMQVPEFPPLLAEYLKSRR